MYHTYMLKIVKFPYIDKDEDRFYPYQYFPYL